MPLPGGSAPSMCLWATGPWNAVLGEPTGPLTSRRRATAACQPSCPSATATGPSYTRAAESLSDDDLASYAGGPRSASGTRARLRVDYMRSLVTLTTQYCSFCSSVRLHLSDLEVPHYARFLKYSLLRHWRLKYSTYTNLRDRRTERKKPF